MYVCDSVDSFCRNCWSSSGARVTSLGWRVANRVSTVTDALKLSVSLEKRRVTKKRKRGGWEGEREREREKEKERERGGGGEGGRYGGREVWREGETERERERERERAGEICHMGYGLLKEVHPRCSTEVQQMRKYTRRLHPMEANLKNERLYTVLGFYRRSRPLFLSSEPSKAKIDMHCLSARVTFVLMPRMLMLPWHYRSSDEHATSERLFVRL